jgi:APA family basic amino acid/polyamine antiporter
MLWLIGPLTIAGTVFLFLNLPTEAMLVLPIWGAVGMVVYFTYSRKRSHLGRGIIEVVDDVAGEETMIPINPPEN